MTKAPTKKQSAAVAAGPSLEEKIRLRAYKLYEERGREDGHDIDDWRRAETELTAKAVGTAASRQPSELATSPRSAEGSFGRGGVFPGNKKGCGIGYALAADSCEGVSSVDTCTVAAPDAITAFAVPNPNSPSQGSRFFRVWWLGELPRQADHPAYLGSVNVT